MILTENGYTYIRREWDGVQLLPRTLLPVDFAHPIPILDGQGLTNNPPMLSDIYHLVETATMIANMVQHTNADSINHASTDTPFNTNMNTKGVLDEVSAFIEDPKIDVIESEYSFPDIALFATSSLRENALFVDHAVPRETVSVSRVTNGTDVRALYSELDKMKRFMISLESCTKNERDADFGFYEDGDKPAVLGPYIYSGGNITITHHTKIGAEWTTTTDTQGKIWGLGYYAAWDGGELTAYDTYSSQRKVFDINRTGYLSSYIRAFDFVDTPSAYWRFWCRGTSNYTSYPIKYGYVKIPSLHQTSEKHSYSFASQPSDFVSTIVEAYANACSGFEWLGGYGSFEITFNEPVFDTGAMTLPTALPNGWNTL